jgi:hypothetical protein
MLRKCGTHVLLEREIVPLTLPSVISYITDVALWRCSDSQATPPTGWEYMSTDINKDRGGDWLYFVWKTQRYIN